MAFWSRRIRPPAALRALLDPTERLLAIGDTPGSVAAATQLGLWIPLVGESADGAAWRRVGWADVVKASWTTVGLALVEGERDETGVVTDLPEQVVQLAEPRNLPNVVRARVENSIMRTDPVQLPEGPGRLVARRVPGVDGVTWTARLDVGTPDTPAARATLRAYLERVRETQPAS
ncbi:MAG: hypothetical protein JWN95_2372 [Frankiales bacterium]|nr:hypothetical protein [Frankiales bacterium]